MRSNRFWGQLAIVTVLLLGGTLGAQADSVAPRPPAATVVYAENQSYAFAVDGQLVVEFDMNLDFSTVQRGRVTLSGGSGFVQYVRILPDAPRRVEIGFRDLSYRTAYTVQISGIKNRLGVEMEPLTTRFTTQPFGQSYQAVQRLTVTPGAYAGGRAILLYSVPVTDTALEPSHYTVTGQIRRVQSAERVDGRTVIITFDAPLEPASTYTVHVDHITGTDGQHLTDRCVFLETPDTALRVDGVTIYRDYGLPAQTALPEGRLEPGSLTLALTGIENNTGAQENAVAIAALYQNGELAEVVQAPLPRASLEGETPAVTLPFHVPEGAAYTLKLLIWDIETLTPKREIQVWST